MKEQIKNQKSKIKINHRLSTRYFRPSTNSGFTLVETLIAIAILMIAIAGPLTVAEKSLYASIYAKNQVMASYLAQDAMESIRNSLDTNEFKGNTGTNWPIYFDNTNLLTSCANKLNQCSIDTINKKVFLNQYPLTVNPTNGNGYVQPASLPTSNISPFTRTFYIQTFQPNGANSQAVNVIVSVSWPGTAATGGGVTLTDTIYDTPLQ
ncbi:MAG: prepilin-type N-terminal cleavage/methylation domain-containing protein [Patescibacteria group bacterium]|nr:prepilin-type N-terminal cleavage/methylation domain-containing protein [Patescibacteria group bacterium]